MCMNLLAALSRGSAPLPSPRQPLFYPWIMANIDYFAPTLGKLSIATMNNKKPPRARRWWFRGHWCEKDQQTFCASPPTSNWRVLISMYAGAAKIGSHRRPSRGHHVANLLCKHTHQAWVTASSNRFTADPARRGIISIPIGYVGDESNSDENVWSNEWEWVMLERDHYVRNIYKSRHIGWKINYTIMRAYWNIALFVENLGGFYTLIKL